MTQATPIVSVGILRMSTSRTDHTKYEHFVRLKNSAGKAMEIWMRHDPVEALFHVHELAQFLGIEPDPLVIDGVTIELDEIGKIMLRNKDR
jgi:hypothetical protein